MHVPKNELSLKETAKDIAALFEIDSKRGMEIARLVSESARLELSQVRRKFASKQGNNSDITQPSNRDLRIHALTQGLPFIGFGIMDNAILIWAGDKIDTHLGVLFGISTLCAAAIGNIISDIAGVGLGAYIEDFCSTKLRLPKVTLSNAQRQLRSVRMAGQLGNVIGLTIGCIIGMFPLLFIDSDEVQKNKKKAKIFDLFRDVMSEAKGLVGAESTCLFLLMDDESSEYPSLFKERQSSYDSRYIFGKIFDDSNACIEGANVKTQLRTQVGRGLVSKAIMGGEIVNVADVQTHPDYDPEISVIQHLHKGKSIKQMLCVPVLDRYGNTIAVIQATNKEDGLHGRFSKADENVLQALATHISVTLQNYNSEGSTSLKEIIQILKEHGNGAIKNE